MKRLAILLLLLSCNVAIAQEDESNSSDTPKPTQPTVKHVYLIFSETQPDKIILLNDKGTWIPDVKSITITMTIGEMPKVTAILWKGYYKPTNPQRQVWPLKQAKSVSASEFQKYIDQLQEDPNSLGG